MRDFEDLKKRLMKKGGFSAAYKKRKPLVNFINDILVLRAKKGWSQKDLADACGMKTSNMSRIESGKQNLSYETMRKISDALGGELLLTLRGDKFIELSDEVLNILKQEKEPDKFLTDAVVAYKFNDMISFNFSNSPVFSKSVQESLENKVAYVSAG